MSGTPNSKPLIPYVLHLADNALILAQRNAEWCGHGPVLEQDIAISNISLDLLGQARNFYQYAAQLINKSQSSEGSEASPSGGGLEGAATEDSLAYLRNANEFKNFLLLELPKGDWAQTITRQFLFSSYQYLLFDQIQRSTDQQLAAIAVKSLKEVTYHVRWSSEWVIRLGDGTEESHQRMVSAINELWKYTGEFFSSAAFEADLFASGEAINTSGFEKEWNDKIKEVLDEATLNIPAKTGLTEAGKLGHHVFLNELLEELQQLQRTYPGAEW